MQKSLTPVHIIHLFSAADWSLDAAYWELES